MMNRTVPIQHNTDKIGLFGKITVQITAIKKVKKIIAIVLAIT